MTTETVKVTWVTLIEEIYSAEIPVSEYNEMVNAGTYADDLAEWEDSNNPIGVSVTGREIEGIEG